LQEKKPNRHNNVAKIKKTKHEHNVLSEKSFWNSQIPLEESRRYEDNCKVDPIDLKPRGCNMHGGERDKRLGTKSVEIPGSAVATVNIMRHFSAHLQVTKMSACS
jgi:hypothetical protein